MADDLNKKVNRLEQKIKIFEQTFKQQNLIAKKYDEALIMLEEKEKFLSAVIESNKNAIIALDKNHIVLTFNKAAQEMFGFTKDEMLYKDSLRKIIPSYLYEKHRRATAEYFTTGVSKGVLNSHVNMDAQKRDGTIFPIRIGFGVSEMNDGVIVVANIEDLSQSQQIQKEKEALYYKANHDALTGIANRLMFQNHIENVTTEAKETNRAFALLYIDLDKFKVINDTLGHDYGDEVLKIVSKRMQNIIREDDLLSRLGGDEFAIILKNISNEKEIESIAKKLLDTIEETMHINQNTLSVSASIGISIFPQDGKIVFDIIKNADKAMYNAKNDRSNKYLFYN